MANSQKAVYSENVGSRRRGKASSKARQSVGVPRREHPGSGAETKVRTQ